MAVQFLTGRGNLRDYLLRRFRLQLTDRICKCGQGAEDIQHDKAICANYGRAQIQNLIAAEYGNMEIELRRGNSINSEKVRKLDKWATAALDTEDYKVDNESSEDEEDFCIKVTSELNWCTFFIRFISLVISSIRLRLR